MDEDKMAVTQAINTLPHTQVVRFVLSYFVLPVKILDGFQILIHRWKK